jgi:hypothetical protein
VLILFPIPPRVIAGHSRPKDGVASLAYDPAIQLFAKEMDARVKPGHDVEIACNRLRSV